MCGQFTFFLLRYFPNGIFLTLLSDYFGSELWRSLSNRLSPEYFPNDLDSLLAPRRVRDVAEPRRELHAFSRKCDASYTPRRPQTATRTTRVMAPIAIMGRYAMVRPLLGVGCPAAVGHVKRVVANAGANSPAQRWLQGVNRLAISPGKLGLTSSAKGADLTTRHEVVP